MEEIVFNPNDSLEDILQEYANDKELCKAIIKLIKINGDNEFEIASTHNLYSKFIFKVKYLYMIDFENSNLSNAIRHVSIQENRLTALIEVKK
jgi:hypothetical protein